MVPDLAVILPLPPHSMDTPTKVPLASEFPSIFFSGDPRKWTFLAASLRQCGNLKVAD